MISVLLYEDQRTGRTVVALGSTEHPSRRKTRYAVDEWRQFVAAVKRGEFDDTLETPLDMARHEG